MALSDIFQISVYVENPPDVLTVVGAVTIIGGTWSRLHHTKKLNEKGMDNAMKAMWAGLAIFGAGLISDSFRDSYFPPQRAVEVSQP